MGFWSRLFGRNEGYEKIGAAERREIKAEKMRGRQAAASSDALSKSRTGEVVSAGGEIVKDAVIIGAGVLNPVAGGGARRGGHRTQHP